MYGVTPCVGVWIETPPRVSGFSSSQSHPAWVCGLKQLFPTVFSGTKSHTLRGCVDWNWCKKPQESRHLCHTLRGCVDWNMYKGIVENRSYVTPCVGVWIETYSEHIANVQKGHTLRGCVDWNNDEVNTCIDNHSHTLRGCIWIEALFTRWSSLWKNCKHSASCVFLFKLL